MPAAHTPGARFVGSRSRPADPWTHSVDLPVLHVVEQGYQQADEHHGRGGDDGESVVGRDCSHHTPSGETTSLVGGSLSHQNIRSSPMPSLLTTTLSWCYKANPCLRGTNVRTRTLLTHPHSHCTWKVAPGPPRLPGNPPLTY